MSEPKEWVTVEEAAVLAQRSKRAIYEWITDGKLAMRRDAKNRMIVLSKAVLRIEPTIRRGRPKGTATRRA